MPHIPPEARRSSYITEGLNPMKAEEICSSDHTRCLCILYEVGQLR
ncbi:hypothetical protein BRADI_1g42561v3 [Brachypodium distachyon]|uniref:Uncharacterized protein n=1 Tax=Brachypodium distachyon TaxID=15368 RepID=A0A2K2DNX8_BRADI|nr:hypothetical protein BRADI_1g42561v3 [Brachypodium distachyon]